MDLQLPLVVDCLCTCWSVNDFLTSKINEKLSLHIKKTWRVHIVYFGRKKI